MVHRFPSGCSSKVLVEKAIFDSINEVLLFAVKSMGCGPGFPVYIFKIEIPNDTSVTVLLLGYDIEKLIEFCIIFI